MRPSVVMQQNDIPTSLSSKWSFLFNCIEQINQLTIVEFGSNRLTWLKKTFLAWVFCFNVDVVGCPGSNHECACLELSYIIHFLSPVTIFHRKFFLVCLTSNEMHELSRRLTLFSESSCATHFPDLRIFPISCNRLETVALSTPNCSASSPWIYNGFSPIYDFKASVLEIRGIPERCRSLASKSPSLKRQNQYLLALNILPFFELVENTVSNMQFLVAHLVRIIL
uniref:Uncharacterized protein n=1 Tax=Heterorhabditis bacteriophora TaxID=37862 RepID=A0A1I7X5B0_HETBA